MTATTLAKNSVEFEKGTTGYVINSTEVRESFSYNVFSCSFPKLSKARPSGSFKLPLKLDTNVGMHGLEDDCVEFPIPETDN
jgi:hypothetical protein